MSFDYEKANIRLNAGNGTGGNGADGTVGAIVGGVSNQNNRALDQAGASHQVLVGGDAFGGRFHNISNQDWSQGVFVGHSGHNSPYRTFTVGFGRWRFFSGGSLTEYVEYETFSIATVGDIPNTFAHVIDLNSTPTNQVGSFDATNVTRVQYEEAGSSLAAATTVLMFSFYTFLSNNVLDSNAPRIYDTTTIESWVRELRNDNLGEGLGGPTNLGKLTEAVENSAILITNSMPIVFGKTGSQTVIDGTSFDYQVGKNSTLVHVTGDGIAWLGDWDTSVSGQSLNLTGSTITHRVPSDFTVFDVDNANVAITITGVVGENWGDIRLGSSCAGTPSSISMGVGKTLTSAIPIDSFNVSGSLRYEGAAGTLTNVNATRLILENAGTYTFTNCDISEVENVSGGSVTINLDGTLAMTEFETSGAISQVAAPTPSSITLQATDASWAIYDDTGTRVANGSGDTTYSNAGGVDAGTWSIVVNRAGYVAEVYTWVSDDGTANSATYGDVQLLRPEGGAAYSGGATTGLTVAVNGDNYVEVNTPNSSVTPQVVVDAQQDFLSTTAGLDWVYDTGNTSAPIWGSLNGVNYFLTIEGFQYDSIAGVTPEAALAAVLVSSASHANIRTNNGGLTVLAAASSPWDSALTDHVDAGSFGQWIQTQIQAGIADAVWDEPAADHVAVGSTGEAVQAGGDATAAQQTAILNAVAALNDLSAADVTGAVPTTAQIEAALLNEGDGQQLIDAIVQAIDAADIAEPALVAAIRADIERAGGMLDLVETKTEADARQVSLIAEHDATQTAISSNGGLTAADVWAEVLEGSESATEMMRLFRSALVGKAAGADTTTMTFRDAADSKDRITATVDEFGNRSAVTADPS